MRLASWNLFRVSFHGYSAVPEYLSGISCVADGRPCCLEPTDSVNLSTPFQRLVKDKIATVTVEHSRDSRNDEPVPVHSFRRV